MTRGRPPDERGHDADEWGLLLEEVGDRILWDADFEMGDVFLDLPPDAGGEHLEGMGIDPDYYLAVPREPDAAGLKTARETLARLLELLTGDGRVPR